MDSSKHGDKAIIMGCVQGKEELILKKSRMSYTTWNYEQTTTLKNWLKCEAEKYGFSSVHHLFPKSFLKPSALWNIPIARYDVLLPAPADSQDLDIKYVYNRVQIEDTFTHITYDVKLHRNYKSLLHGVSRGSTNSYTDMLAPTHVIGYRDHVIVTQILRNDYIQDIVVINMYNCKELFWHSEYYTDCPCLFDCEISPDSMTYLLKPNLQYSTEHNLSTASENCTRVLQHSRDIPHHYDVVSTLFHGVSEELVVVFSPQYRSSCIAVGNLLTNDGYVICVYDLKQNVIKSKILQQLPHKCHKLVYSPDGAYLAVLVTQSVNGFLFPHKVIVYDSNTLSALCDLYNYKSTLDEPMLSPAINYFPEFSKTGEFLSLAGVGKLDGTVEVIVFSAPVSLTLQNLCRVLLNGMLTSEEISGLSINDDLKDYLMYKPIKD